MRSPGRRLAESAALRRSASRRGSSSAGTRSRAYISDITRLTAASGSSPRSIPISRASASTSGVVRATGPSWSSSQNSPDAVSRSRRCHASGAGGDGSGIAGHSTSASVVIVRRVWRPGVVEVVNDVAFGVGVHPHPRGRRRAQAEADAALRRFTARLHARLHHALGDRDFVRKTGDVADAVEHGQAGSADSIGYMT